MCGIHFTLSSKHTGTNLDAFMKDAFIANQVRGTDSSGYFRVTHPFTRAHGKAETRSSIERKKAVCGSLFINDPQIKGELGGANHMAALVGHVRHRTSGSITDKNAHPFTIMRNDLTEVVGVHNGSLTNWRNMVESNDYDVDSEWLYNMIADHGMDIFKAVDGAYALVWWDSANPDVMNVVRNDKRPLYFAYTKDRKAIIGASELGMLGWLAERNNVELDTNNKGEKFFYFAAGKHYHIDLNTMEVKNVGDVPAYDATYDKYKKPPAPAVSYPSTANYPATTYHPAQRYNSPSTVGNSTSWNYSFNMDKVCDNVTSVLASARKRRADLEDLRNGKKPADAEVVTQDELFDGGDIAATTQGDLAIEGVAIGQRLMYAENIVPSAATAKEIMTARELGYFGLIGHAWAYFHDTDLSELQCSWSVKPQTIPAGREMPEFSNDSVIRFVTTAQIDNTYSDKSMSGMSFIVVGVKVTKDQRGRDMATLVLMPLTSAHRKVERRVAPEPTPATSSTMH